MHVTAATADPEPYFVRWSEHMREGGALAGFDLSVPKNFSSLLADAGFVNVQIQWQNWPIGTWAKGAKNKHIGYWWGEDLKTVSRSAGAMFTRVLGWKQEDFDELAAQAVREIEEQRRHMWIEV